LYPEPHISRTVIIEECCLKKIKEQVIKPAPTQKFGFGNLDCVGAGMLPAPHILRAWIRE